MTYLMNEEDINTQIKHIKFTNAITKTLTPLNLSILSSKDLDFLSSFNTQEGMSGFTQTQYIYKYHYRPQLPIEPNFNRYTFGGKKQFYTRTPE